jgi:hypothetical protein
MSVKNEDGGSQVAGGKVYWQAVLGSQPQWSTYGRKNKHRKSSSNSAPHHGRFGNA